MRSLRFVVLAAAFAASAALTPLVSADAGPSAVPVGQIAFVTKTGDLDLAAVLSDGTLSAGPEQIAPVTTVAAPEYVEVSDVVVSGDQKWLAWNEDIYEPNKMFGKEETGSRVVVRQNSDGATTVLHSELEPLGFAGDSLVAISGNTYRLAMTPSPHFVRVQDKNGYPVATYPRGVVDVASHGDGTVDHEQLRLTTFAGRHTVLHQYDVGLEYRNVTANLDAVSPDGKHLLVERGNHQDFDGLGPSSLFDEYTLSGSNPRRQLGHYGANAAKWRLVNATFVGKQDTPWLALHSGYTKVAKNDYVVHGVVVSYVGGKWQLAQAGGIAVAGSPLGYAAVQPGEWVLQKNSPDGEYDPVPTADAALWFNGSKVATIPIQGSELVWLTGELPGSASDASS